MKEVADAMTAVGLDDAKPVGTRMLRDDLANIAIAHPRLGRLDRPHQAVVGRLDQPKGEGRW